MDTFGLRAGEVPVGYNQPWSLSGAYEKGSPDHPPGYVADIEVYSWSNGVRWFEGFRARKTGVYRVRMHVGFYQDPRDIYVQIRMVYVTSNGADNTLRWVANMGYPDTLAFDIEGEVLFDQKSTDAGFPVVMYTSLRSGRSDSYPLSKQLAYDNYVEFEYLRES